MTRLFTTGFERQDLSEFSTLIGSVAVAGTSHGGTVAIYLTTGNGEGRIDVPTPTDELYIRSYIKSEGNTSPWKIITIRTSAGEIAYVNGDLSGSQYSLRLFVNGIAVTAAGVARISNVGGYYLIEVHYVIADSGGVFECRVDGVQDNIFTGDTKPSTQTQITQIGWLTGNNSRVDDVAFNNAATGSADNSWCGEGYVVALLPNATGSSIGLSRGGTDSGSNWGQVDERPTNGDTDYVYSPNSGTYDLYSLTDLTLPANNSILRVWPEAACKDPASLLKVDVGIKSGATTDWAASQALGSAYAWKRGTVYTTDPDTGLAWTDAACDILQAGIRVTT